MLHLFCTALYHKTHTQLNADVNEDNALRCAQYFLEDTAKVHQLLNGALLLGVVKDSYWKRTLQDSKVPLSKLDAFLRPVFLKLDEFLGTPTETPTTSVAQLLCAAQRPTLLELRVDAHERNNLVEAFFIDSLIRERKTGQRDIVVVMDEPGYDRINRWVPVMTRANELRIRFVVMLTQQSKMPHQFEQADTWKFEKAAR